MTEPLEQVVNPRFMNTLAKSLSTPMAFVVIMTILTMSGVRWFIEYLPPSSIIAMVWLWFVTVIAMTIIGGFLILQDSRIKKSKK